MPRAVETFAQIIYVTWGESAAVGNVVDAAEGIDGMTRSASKAARSAGSALDELNKLGGVAERFQI